MEEVVMFVIHDQEVDCCGNCPHNKEHPNGLEEHAIFKYIIPKGVLPLTHRCDVSLDTQLFNKEGRLILNPLTIPKWCPFEP